MALSTYKHALLLLLACVAIHETPLRSQAAIVTCLPSTHQLSIQYLWDSDQQGWDDPNCIRFFDLLVIERCGPTHPYAGSACSVLDIREKVVPCRLGTDSFSVILRPVPFNDDLQGACGAYVSGIVSIRKNGKLFLKDIAFDESYDCHADSVRVLSRLTIGPNDTTAHLTYSIRDP
jgi:hypothetical protein